MARNRNDPRTHGHWTSRPAPATANAAVPPLAAPLSADLLSPKRLLPPAVTAPPPSAATPPGYALTTGMGPMITGIVNLSTQAISTAADGSLWVLYQAVSGGSIQLYDYVLGTLQAVYESTGPQIQAIAAASVDSVYLIASDSTTWIGNVNGTGTLQNLGSLPGGAVADQIAAAADGTLWALDDNGFAYQYAAGSWTEQSTAGSASLVFNVISAGSADFILGIASANGGDEALWSWTSGAGWQPFSQIGITAGDWLAAGADGSVWSLNDTVLVLSAPGGILQQMETFALLNASSWTAASQQVAFAIGMVGATPSVVPFALGILDMPAVPWPAMTADQQTAYADINAALQITRPGGIRSQYANSIAPLSSWQTTIADMAAPANVSAADWTIVQTQIVDELTYVQSVNNLFTNLGKLAGLLGTVQSEQLQSVGTAVGLSEQAQGPSEVTVVLNSLVSTLVTRMGSLFPPPYGMVVSIVGSGLMAASTYTEQNVSPNAPGGALQVAYSQLADVMAENLIQTVTEQGDEQTTVVTDWGKLSAAGQAISQGIWTWPDNLTGLMLQGLAPVWNLYFYQALMPAGWQILQGEELFSPAPPPPQPPQAPNHAMLTKSLVDGNNDTLVWYYICCQLGSSNSIIGNNGPYPSPVLMQDILGLGVVPSDFFGDQNGWSLPGVQSPGWNPPPSQVQWNPYNPNDN